MQHLVNERMIQENSGLFADLVGFRGARDTNSESSDDQDLPVMLTQDRRGLPGLEIKEEFPSVRRRAMASTPESASSLFGRAMDRFRGERNRKRIHLSGPIEDVQDLNTTLTNVVQEVSSHRGRGLVISLCHKITSRRDVFSRIVTQSLDPLPFQLAIQASLMVCLPGFYHPGSIVIKLVQYILLTRLFSSCSLPYVLPNAWWCCWKQLAKYRTLSFTASASTFCTRSRS